MKQALELAMVLALEPSVLLLDEPTAGLTKPERTLIGSILVDLVAARGPLHRCSSSTISISCARSRSRIVVLHQGRIAARRYGGRGGRLRARAHHLRGRARTQGAGAMSRAVLEVDGLSSGYGEAIVLRDVSLSIRPGEIFALLGKNGMGKSTLLKTITRLPPGAEGPDPLFGEDVTALPTHLIARKAIAYTPQEQALFQDLTVEDNLRLGLRDDRGFAEGLARVSEYFPFLGKRLSQKAGTLSGGEQKMLIISRALLGSPRLMLIDEISEGLQPSMIQRLTEILEAERKRTGPAILLVEQNVRSPSRWPTATRC